MIKMILVGSWSFSHMEDIFSKNLAKCDFNVIPFTQKIDTKSKLYQQIPVSFAVRALNKELLELTRKEIPEFIFFWNATHITDKTYMAIKELGIKIITYSNDDPYSRNKKTYKSIFMWRLFLRSLKFSDIHFVYRPINILESKKYTSAPVHLLLPYFIPDQIDHINFKTNNKNDFSNDIAFIGHYENDKRLDYLETIYDHGYQLKLYGSGWSASPKTFQHKVGSIKTITEKKYYDTLYSSKICLAFFSTANRDTFTRRCFEIPAAGSLLLCERTEFMKSAFIEDQEAVFFSSKQEMLDKINWLLANNVTRNKIALAGQARVNNDGHDALSRARYFKEIIINS